LPEWQDRVSKLLFALPGNALPRPSKQPAMEAAPCTRSETSSAQPLIGVHTGRCLACA
jgi:hypothetical protein